MLCLLSYMLITLVILSKKFKPSLEYGKVKNNPCLNKMNLKIEMQMVQRV